MSAPLNKNCTLVQRLGQPAYESCKSCDLHLQNCIQFRGQIYTGGLVVLVLCAAFLPLPTWGRGLFGLATVAVLFHFLRYVGRESHVSIVTASRLRVERAQALATARELDQNIKKLEETRDQLIRSDKLAAVGTMAAGIAHEINNPLAFLLSNLRYVREELEANCEGRLDADLWAAMKEAEAGGQRVRQIVADLKTLARDEKPRLGPIDVPEAMRQVVGIARNEIRHKAQLVERYEATPLAMGDAGKLGQVLLNLVVNAVQAIPAGKTADHRLELTITQDADCVVAEVTDTGHGIAPEHLSRLFEPFFTTKPIGVSTGLGLAICQSLVHSMGGSISVLSRPGSGATFKVALPIATPEELAASAAEAGPTLSLERSARRGRILVVDDEPMVGRSIERILRKEHEVVTTTDARTALVQLANDSAFDLLLCDLMMPDLTGDEFHRELKLTHHRLAARTIFMTGGAFTASTRAFLEAAEHPFVQKPFDEARLRALVTRLVNTSEARS